MSLISPMSLNFLSALHTTKTKNDTLTGFPGHSDYKESACKAGDPGSVLGWEDMEKEMATHSSVLAWRIPGTGEPCGLLSVGSHRVRHD